MGGGAGWPEGEGQELKEGRGVWVWMGRYTRGCWRPRAWGVLRSAGGWVPRLLLVGVGVKVLLVRRVVKGGEGAAAPASPAGPAAELAQGGAGGANCINRLNLLAAFHLRSPLRV